MWVRVLKVLATAVCIVIINAAAYIVDKGVLTVHHSGDTVHARMLENVSPSSGRSFDVKQPPRGRPLLTAAVSAVCIFVTVVLLTASGNQGPTLHKTLQFSGRLRPLVSTSNPVDLPSLIAHRCPTVNLTGRRVVVTATTPHVAMVVHPSGEQISNGLVTAGEWDGLGGQLLMQVAANASAARGATQRGAIIDAGANIGAMGIRWAAAGWSVHAFEATAANYALLVCSAGLNDLPSFVAHNVALGDREGISLCMQTVPPNMGMSSVATSGDGNTRRGRTQPGDNDGELSAADCGGTAVPQRTIDSYVLAEKAAFWDNFDLLKIDVEGHEPALLEGAQRTLAHPNLAPAAVAIEVSVHRWRERFDMDATSVLRLITRHGYAAIEPPEALADVYAWAEATAKGEPVDLILMRQ